MKLHKNHQQLKDLVLDLKYRYCEKEDIRLVIEEHTRTKFLYSSALSALFVCVPSLISSFYPQYSKYLPKDITGPLNGMEQVLFLAGAGITLGLISLFAVYEGKDINKINKIRDCGQESRFWIDHGHLPR